MKTLLLALLLTSCAATSADVKAYTPDLSTSYEAAIKRSEEIERDLNAAHAELQVAALTPDTSDDAPIEARIRALGAELESVNEQLDSTERVAMERKYGPLTTAVDLLTPGTGLGSLGLAALALYPTSRRRKRYSEAFKQLKTGNVLLATGELLKVIGAQHSTEASAKAAEKPAPPPQA